MDAEKKISAAKFIDNLIDNVGQDKDISETGDYTGEELKFAIFCIENVAARLRVDASVIYDAFTRSSDILDSYIIPCYDVLHTQRNAGNHLCIRF